MYVLCFKYLTQDYERFLEKNKKKTTFVVSITLTELGFNVRAVSEYICRWCQKLDHLQQNLEDLQIPRGRRGGGISLTMAAPPRTWQRRSHEQNSKSARAFETFLHFLAVLCKSSTSTLQNFFNQCLPADWRWMIMLNLRHLGGHYSGIIIYWMYTLWLHRWFVRSERRETLLYFTLYR